MATHQNDDLLGALGAILKANVSIRADGKPASGRTKQQAADVLKYCFLTLRELGFVVMPAGLGDRHVQALMNYWWYEKKLKVCTITNYLGTLRKFSTWIGKRGMVKKPHDYLPQVPPSQFIIRAAAIQSKSWSAQGIDEEKIFELADEIDPRFGCILRAQRYFGLRLKEALQFRPWVWDFGSYVMMPDGVAKGGRSRPIQVRNQQQRDVLELIKSRIGKADCLGWSITKRRKIATLKSNRQRYYYQMKKIGMTKKAAGVCGHSLRAAFAEDAVLERGWTPPTLGGISNQIAKEDEILIRSQTAQDMGHNRHGFGSAYYGSFRRPKKPKA